MGEYSPKTVDKMYNSKGTDRFLNYYDEDLLTEAQDDIEKKANAIDSLGKTVKEDIDALNTEYAELQEQVNNGIQEHHFLEVQII